MPSGGARRRLKSSFIHEAAAAAAGEWRQPPSAEASPSQIFKTAFCFDFRKVVGHFCVQNSKSLSLVCMNGDPDVCVLVLISCVVFSQYIVQGEAGGCWRATASGSLLPRGSNLAPPAYYS